jgi:hypothetical protein
MSNLKIYTLLIQHDLLKVLKKEPIKAGLLESLKAERKPTVAELTSHYQHEAGIYNGKKNSEKESSS